MRRGVLVTSAVVALSIGANVAAFASSSSSTKPIAACYVPKSGAVRIVGSTSKPHCRTGEKALVWATSGHAGQRGAVGATGAVGPQGLAGPAGAAGAAGAVGAAGAPGAVGPAGATGAPGSAGATGAMGLMGPMGLPGATGQAGPTGATGPTGPTGVAGPSGPTGQAGPAGSTGSAGPAGPSGAPGAQGLAGPTGPAGSAAAVVDVLDANGAVVGPFLGESADGSSLTLFMTLYHGHIWHMVSDGRFGPVVTGQYLYFTTTDCTGTAYINGGNFLTGSTVGTSNSGQQGGTTAYVLGVALTTTIRAAEAMGSPTCATVQATTSAWTPVTTIAVPDAAAGPITVGYGS